YIPPEFGWKAGGVLEVRSAARTSEHWAGTTDLQFAADDTRELSTVAGGPLGAATALTAGITRQSSSRFLDPVHPGNLHNDGTAWSGGAQIGWSVSPASTITAVASVGRSDFDVPHGEDQERAGQDQQQRVRQYAQSLSWQRVWSGRTVSQVAEYFRRGSAAVDGSASDTPLFVHTNRSLDRAGLLASVSHHRGRHLFKAGGEMSFLRLREDFLFAITDPEEAEAADLSDAVLEFTLDDPFRFHGNASPSLFSIFAQDSIRVSDRLTVDAGVRVDWSRLLAHRTQVSPRFGATYFLPRTATTLRSSVGRFFQPPQPENLLLSSSDEAWQLSPFRDETGGGAPLEPERQTAFEVGINQPLTGALRLDVAYWHRRMKHVSDPNVFFGTTVIFPNAVARGRASGLEVRMELPRYRGWSGYVSYANSRVVQFGPISGGLFLEEEVIEIGPGTAFTPDHDQRNVGAFGLTYDGGGGAFQAAFTGRHESGTPLEVDEDEIDELRDRPGAEMVDFDRGRVKPRTVLDLTASTRLVRHAGVDLSLRAAVLNLTGTRRAYNFGNPFSGTHFGPGRTAQIGVRVAFR
ncbi:MAG: TonB-dependent receptor domain-containing protein, partial [Vicinamibacterales bacterium]